MRVLIVDDSSVFRTQIRRALTDVPGVEVVGSASTGRIALQMLEQKSIDLVTLDLNMPDLSGLDTLREIRRVGRSVRVVVFAAKSARSAEETIDALRGGADDFVVKPDGETQSLDKALEQVRSELLPKIMQFAASPTKVAAPEMRRAAAGAPATSTSVVSAPSAVAASYRRRELTAMSPLICVVASSTGGPSALEVLVSKLRKPPRIPILIAQHMPETFTRYLAKRLSDVSAVPCREGVDGESLRPGVIYVAPGNFHMRVKQTGSGCQIALDQGPKVNSVRPAADLLFVSAAEIYGDACVGFVLTGMGEDGLAGARRIKELSGGVMIQNKESCVVWGMPAAVFQAGCFDSVGDLEECATMLAKLCG